jgi:glycosyltransferase involved in cell wall biosynthesis
MAPPAAGGDPFRIGWFHHGCDFQSRRPHPDAAAPATPQNLAAGPTLLMVGTVEPRKGYLEVIEAASLLWQRGVAFNLVIVGREGWMDLPEARRRSIPRTVTAIRQHPQLGRRLFWWEGASDAELDRLYRQADGLIGASFGEGFGIPLIEAASYSLPLLLRDLPVFQEVTQGNAVFFPAAADRDELAAAIAGFLGRLADQASITALVGRLEPQSWRQSAEQLLRSLGLEPGPELAIEAAALSSNPRGQADQRPRQGRRQRLKSRLRRLAKRWLLRPSPAPAHPDQPLLPAAAAAWLQELRRDPSRQNPQTNPQ